MTGENRVILYAFWASSCSWRARAALYAKHIEFEERPVDILKDMQQKTESFRAINPVQKVPAVVFGDFTVVESMAILQYLEETHPQPSLVPPTPLLRARMREIIEIVVSEIQPLQQPSIKPFFQGEEYPKFTKYWVTKGLEALETLLSKTAGRFCIGDQLTMADICLVPQVYNAIERHNVAVDAETFPIVSRLYSSLLKEDVFVNTHPQKVKSIDFTFCGCIRYSKMH